MGKKKKNIVTKISRVSDDLDDAKLIDDVLNKKDTPSSDPTSLTPIVPSIPPSPIVLTIPPVPTIVSHLPVSHAQAQAQAQADPRNIFKDLQELKKTDPSKISNELVKQTYTQFLAKQEVHLKTSIDNSNKIIECNKSIVKNIANIRIDVVELSKLHKDLMENKLQKKNLQYVDSIFFQKSMIEVELYSNQKIQRKYLNKFYSDLYNIILSIKNSKTEKDNPVKIPDNILKYNVLYDSMSYEYDDIFNAVRFILDHQLSSINNIISDLDFIYQMEIKEGQGYCLKEFNTNLNYKVLNKMSYVNYVFEKINYIIDFQLQFADKFNIKMNTVAGEVDIKY